MSVEGRPDALRIPANFRELKSIRLPSTNSRMTTWGRWLPPLIWAAQILALSSRPATFFFARPQGTQYQVVHHGLEIAIHLVQFGVLFLLVVRPLRSWALPKAAVLGSAFGAALVVSLLNESIQALTPTRMFDVWDMTVDALGAGIGMLLVMARDRRS